MKTVREQIKSGLIGGAVVLAGNVEKDLFTHADGIADWQTGSLMTMDSVFDVASVTKVVGTNSVLLGAIADGLVDLDRALTDYLPGLNSRNVKVREFAQHISGVNIKYCHVDDQDEMYRGILNVDFPFPPRARYEYTCTNYILIGFMLEHLYGRRLDELAAERVLRPLNMTETTWVHPGAERLSRTIRTVNEDPGTISDFRSESICASSTWKCRDLFDRC